MAVTGAPPPPVPPPDGSAHAAVRLSVPVWARIAISAAVVGGLLHVLDVRQIGAVLVDANLPLLGLLLGLTLSERAYSALRWYQLLRWNGANVPVGMVLRITFASAFAGLSLPGALGTEAFRVIGLARYSKDAAMAFSSVLVDRLLAAITLIPFVFIGLALAPAGMPDGVQATAWVVLAATLAAYFLVLHPAPGRWAARLMPLVSQRARRVLRQLYQALDAFRAGPLMLMHALLLAIGFQVLRILVVWVSARAVGIDVSPAYFFVFTPVIVLLTMAPVSFVGVGVREAAYVYLFSLVAVPAEQAFAASVLVLAAGLMSCLPGAWLLVSAGSKRTTRQEERLECKHW